MQERLLEFMMNLKKILSYAACILLFGAFLTPLSFAEKPQKIVDIIPDKPLSPLVDLMLVGSKGEAFSLAPHAGHPYLLHIWATWCPPCRDELPSLAKFLKKNPEAAIVPLVVESGSPMKVKGFLNHMGIEDLPIWIADRNKIREIIQKIPNSGLPMTLLIDDTGHIRGVSAGPLDWGATDALDELSDLLTRTQNLSHDKSVVKEAEMGNLK